MAGFVKQLLGYRIVSSRAGGDTLQQIAARELGDASRWPDLAAINGLLPPYITTDLGAVTAGVLFAGQSLKVPSAAPAALNGITGPDQVLGTDFLLVDGAFVDDGAGDIEAVSGADNLAQAISHRLATHPQELAFHPKYGCKVYTLIGGASNAVDAQLAAAFCEQAVLSDPRVASTSGLKATLRSDQVNVTGTAVSVDGKSIPVSNK